MLCFKSHAPGESRGTKLDDLGRDVERKVKLVSFCQLRVHLLEQSMLLQERDLHVFDFAHVVLSLVSALLTEIQVTMQEVHQIGAISLGAVAMAAEEGRTARNRK